MGHCYQALNILAKSQMKRLFALVWQRVIVALNKRTKNSETTISGYTIPNIKKLLYS